MLKRLIALIMAACILLGGCASQDMQKQSSGTATIYYTSAERQNSINDPLVGVEITVVDEQSTIEAVLEALWSTPNNNELESAMPEELSFVRWENTQGKMTIELNDYYLDMSGIDKTIATAALVHTLCGLDGVDSLSIYVGENEIYSEMTKEDMLLYDKEADPYEREVKIFLSDEEGKYLYDYTYVYTVGGTEVIEQYVMDVLLGEELQEGVVSYIPEGTKVNDIYVDDEVCTVDLSAEFYEGRPDSPVTERVIIYSIVNTITAIAGNKSVQFLINGEMLDYYVTIPLDEPLERNSNMQPGSTGTEVTVCMWSEIRNKLVELPVIVTGEYETEAREILGAINEWTTEAGYTNPVPAGTQYYSGTQINDSVAVVDLSNEFRNAPAGESAENMEWAIKALAIALDGSYEASSIKVLCESADIIIDGINLSETVSFADLH